MSAPNLPNRFVAIRAAFLPTVPLGCLGLLVFPILGRAVFASIAYATKRLTDTVCRCTIRPPRAAS